jgi:signal transduction histidine kinase
VELSAVSNDAGVVITVKDDGIGIPPEIMAVLFTTGAEGVRFGTADEKGSGYGLVMCKEIVEAHGGLIDARSEEGKGTTFFVRLPA